MKEAVISLEELDRYKEFHARIYHRMLRLINDGELTLVIEERQPYVV